MGALGGDFLHMFISSVIFELSIASSDLAAKVCRVFSIPISLLSRVISCCFLDEIPILITPVHVTRKLKILIAT